MAILVPSHAWTKLVAVSPGCQEQNLLKLRPSKRAVGSLAIGVQRSWGWRITSCFLTATLVGRRHKRCRYQHSARNETIQIGLAAGALESDLLDGELKGKAILVGWDPSKKEKLKDGMPTWSPYDSLDELENLCKTLGVEVKYRVLQNWNPEMRSLPIGRGKAAELREQVRSDPQIGIVIFDKDLGAGQLMKLQGRIDPDGDTMLLDRSAVIIRIFAQRAQTAEAKLQVKYASQQYMIPRLRYFMTSGGGMEMRGGSASGSVKGGAALRGPGESQINMDRNYLRKQMQVTQKKIKEVSAQRQRLFKKHNDLGVPIIALVGYTNAGKSSLLNRLSNKKEVSVEDRLFETLDTTRRLVKLQSGREVMIADTVGFIQRLPTQLVDGFKATLEEVGEATIVVHVVDASSPTCAAQVAAVHRTLKEVDYFDHENTAQLLVLNKMDKLEGGIPPELEQSLSFPWPGIVGRCSVSARAGTGLDVLAEIIEDTLQKHSDFCSERMQLLIPYAEGAWYGKVRGPPPLAKVNKEAYTDDGYLLDVVTSPGGAQRLRRFQVPTAQLPTPESKALERMVAEEGLAEMAELDDETYSDDAGEIGESVKRSQQTPSLNAT